MDNLHVSVTEGLKASDTLIKIVLHCIQDSAVKATPLGGPRSVGNGCLQVHTVLLEHADNELSNASELTLSLQEFTMRFEHIGTHRQQKLLAFAVLMGHAQTYI